MAALHITHCYSNGFVPPFHGGSSLIQSELLDFWTLFFNILNLENATFRKLGLFLLSGEERKDTYYTESF